MLSWQLAQGQVRKLSSVVAAAALVAASVRPERRARKKCILEICCFGLGGLGFGFSWK